MEASRAPNDSVRFGFGWNPSGLGLPISRIESAVSKPADDGSIRVLLYVDMFILEKLSGDYTLVLNAAIHRFLQVIYTAKEHKTVNSICFE